MLIKCNSNFKILFYFSEMANVKSDDTHLRHCMLFLFRQKINATEATRIICSVYGDVLKVNKCQRWFRKFGSGNFDISDGPRSGRPTELDDDMLKAIVELDPRQSIQELSDKLNSSWSTVQEHLAKIGKVSRQGIWIPHNLTENNKLTRLTICISLLSRQQSDPFLHRIITGDEKWVLYVNNKRKRQWLSHGQTPIPTAKDDLHPKKVLLCVWWDSIGIIHFELLKYGQTITAEVYCEQLDRLHKSLTLKRPALLNRKGVILQQDNARPHSAKKTTEKIRKLGWEILPHPPYSPDIAPSDYHLFRSLEHYLGNKTFRNPDDVHSGLTDFFSSKDANFYKKGIEMLKNRWQTIINNDGDYILD